MGTRVAMSGILLRHSSSRSIGVLVQDRRIAICVLPSTDRGRRPVACGVHDCGEEPIPDVMRRMLEPYLPAKNKRATPGPWVQLGISDADAFQAVVPITQANRNANAQSYFLEAVQATNIRAEDRILDLIRLELNKQPIACVAASPSGVISDLMHMMGELGLRVGLIEPAPAAMFRAGSFHARAPRGSMLCMRFFLGPQQAIGVLGTAQQPLFWHEFSLEPGQETNSILAAYSTLWMLGRNGRISVPIDTVVVHGRPELPLSQDADEFRRRTGARLIRSDQPGYGAEAAALGLALANPLSDELRIDLARDSKPSPTIRDVFPWKELALHGALLGSISLLLLGMSTDAGVRLRAAEAEVAAFPWAKDLDQAKLDGEKKVLEERTKAIAAFQGTRVAWSVPLRTMAAAAPQNTVITSLLGDGEVEGAARAGPGKSKKQLVISFETPMAEDGSLPREIDGFLASLRGDPSLKRHFPLIEVTALRANPVRQGVPPSASYSVVCLPRVEKTAVPKAGPAVAQK
jgi:hypothetical protein